MQLLHLLPIASLALALTHANEANTKRQTSCYSQAWNIQQYTAFTAGPTSPAGGPSSFTDSHISFLFADPNFDIQYQCGAEAETGKSLESLQGFNNYYCAGGNMSFQYFGSTVDLQRTGVSCGDITYTESGSTGLSLECYPLFGGQQCQTATQVNVNISFLTQTN